MYIALWGPSLTAASEGCSSLLCRFLCSGLSCCRAQALEHKGFSSCSTWAQQLRHRVLDALRYVGSPPIRGRTHVSCSGRRIPSHCATRRFPETGVYVCVCSVISDSATLWAVACQAPRSMGFSRLSSPPRDWTRVPSTGRQILYCCATWDSSIKSPKGTEVLNKHEQNRIQAPQWS